MRALHFAWPALAVVLAAASALAAASCGSDREPLSNDVAAPDRPEEGELDGLQSIVVSPSAADLVAGDTNQSQAFTAEGRFRDGSTRDLTQIAVWKASVPNLVVMNGPTAVPTGSRGGVAKVSAIAGSVSGDAEVRVKWVKTIVSPGASAADKARFEKATEDAALAPTLAYPIAGALFPPNLPPIEVQWRPAAATDVFDVNVAGATMDLHVLTPCNAIASTGGCGLAFDANTWTGITSTLGGEDPAEVAVRGAGATQGKVGTSAKASAQFAKTEIRGGLYYFNTRATATEKPGIYRYDFSSNKVGSFYTSGQCAGCHALSKDGTKMLAAVCTDERGCGRPLQLAVVDVATQKVVSPAMPAGDTDTQAWTPDNKYYVTTPTCATISPAPPGGCATPGTGTMTLVDATTNAPVGPVPSGAGSMYPSFSNDGKRLVYARAGTFRGPLSVQHSSLYFLEFNGTGGSPAWSVEKPLLIATATEYENNYHPSFSPDDAWVLFTRSRCQATDDPAAPDINANYCDSYNDPTARTWVVPSAGGAAIECARGNGDGRNIVSWPKWSPFKSTYKGGDVYWYTVSSVRDYGFRALHGRDAIGNPTNGVTQLWLVGFDPKKASASQDPTFSPVWLPFQDVASSNHIGQWTEAIVGPVK